MYFALVLIKLVTILYAWIVFDNFSFNSSICFVKFNLSSRIRPRYLESETLDIFVPFTVTLLSMFGVSLLGLTNIEYLVFDIFMVSLLALNHSFMFYSTSIIWFFSDLGFLSDTNILLSSAKRRSLCLGRADAMSFT